MLTPQEAAGCNTQGDGTIGLFMAGNTTGGTSTTVDALSLSFAGEGAASVGISGGSVVISVIQDGAGINAAVRGNTSGVVATVATGTLLLAGGNNVTLSQAGNAVTISGPNTAPQTVQSLGLFALGNTTQSTNTTADARSLSFIGQGAASVGMSGGSVQVSVPAQTVQSLGLFASSNTTGQSSSSTIDARSLTLQGAGIASVGMSGGKVIISVPSDVGDGGNVIAGGTQTAVSTGTVVLSNSNNVSFGMSNSSVVTASASFPAQTVQTLGVFASSQTTAQSSSNTVDARSFTHRGMGAVSVGMSGNELVISAPNTVAQSVQSLGIFALGNTTQSTNTTADARSLSFIGLGAVSVGMSGGSVGVSALAQTNQSVGLFAGDNTTQSTSATADARSLSFAGEGAVSIGVSGGSVRVSSPVQSNQQVGIFAVSNTTQSTSQTADARSLSFAGAGAVSVGVSGGTVKVSVAVQSNDSVGLFAGGNTTQSTSNSADIRSMSFAGAGIASVGVSGNSVLVSVPSPSAQTVQSVGLFALGNTTQSTNTTADARSISFVGLGAVSVGMSGGSVGVSAPTQTNQQIGVFAVSNTTQSTSQTADARSLSFAGAGGVSVGVSGGSVMVSAPTPIAQSNQSLGMFALGNTTQSSNTTADARSLSFIGLGAASVGMSGGSVGVSVPAQTNQQLGIFAVSNTTQSTSQTADARSLSFAGAGMASVGVSGGTIKVSVPTPPPMSQWPNFPILVQGTGGMFSGSAGAGGNSSLTTASLWAQPAYIEAPLNFNEIRGFANFPGSTTTTANFGATGGSTIGLYSMNVSTLSLMSSWTHQIQATFTSGAISNSTAMSGTFGGSDTAGSSTYSFSGTQLTAGGNFGTLQSGSHRVPMLTGSSVRSVDRGQYWWVIGATRASSGQDFFQPFNAPALFSQQGLVQQDINQTFSNSAANMPLMGPMSTVMSSNAVWPTAINTSLISNTNISATSLLSQSMFVQILQRTT